ncbi:MAG: hypothetical protein MI808_05245 [Pseudomonadales bacterium]|nr:hypothetical protein [Pseudomonadales bacterium]
MLTSRMADFKKLKTASVLMFALGTGSGCSMLQYVPSTDQLLSFIPGSDRIFHKDSTAEVGPVLTESGELVGEQENAPVKEKADSKATEISAVSNESDTSKSEALDSGSSERFVVKSFSSVIDEEPALPKPAAKPVAAPKPTVKKAPIQQVTKAPKEEAAKRYSVAGNVTLLGKSGAISPDGVIARLHRLDGSTLVANEPTEQHVMDMEQKSYAPGRMVISKGDTISFLNKDSIRHNVFSSTGENAFDLGTFGGGLQRGVTLHKDGVVKVYCNIHPKMAAFVAVDEIGISTLVEINGDFQFKDLEKGEYILTLWSVRGEHTQTLSVGDSPSDDNQLTLNVIFDTASFKAAPRTNKFGEAYKTKYSKREFF